MDPNGNNPTRTATTKERIISDSSLLNPVGLARETKLVKARHSFDQIKEIFF